MTKRCNFPLDENNKCNSTTSLNTFDFHDPTDNFDEKIKICQMHSQHLLTNLLETITRLESQLNDVIESRNKHRIQSQYYELNYEPGYDKKIEDLRKTISEVRMKHCRYELCQHMIGCSCQECKPKGDGRTAYGLTVYSSNGFMRHVFHFHYQCWQKVMARCGIKTILVKNLQARQKTIG